MLCSEKEDIGVWRGKSGYKSSFSTKETWINLRAIGVQLSWPRAVWFSMATPRFAFIVWLAMQNRLSTMDRISMWNWGVDDTCVLCQRDAESRNHLFFKCSYSAQVWYALVKGIFRNEYSEDWSLIVHRLSAGIPDKKALFCLRYSFHATTYAIWRERKRVKHGEKALPVAAIVKITDKGIRNKLSLVKLKGKKGMEGVLRYWFHTRM